MRTKPVKTISRSYMGYPIFYHFVLEERWPNVEGADSLQFLSEDEKPYLLPTGHRIVATSPPQNGVELIAPEDQRSRGVKIGDLFVAYVEERQWHQIEASDALQFLATDEKAYLMPDGSKIVATTPPQDGVEITPPDNAVM